MSIFGGKKSKTKTKPTLLTQQAAGGIFGAFLPWGSGGIQDEKAARAFGGEKHSDSLPPEGTIGDIGWDNPYAPYRRYTADYDPYSYSAARPGGASPYETDLLNRSLYGRTAPLAMGGMIGANQGYGSYLNDLSTGNLMNRMGGQTKDMLGSYSARELMPFFASLGDTAFNYLNQQNPTSMLQGMQGQLYGQLQSQNPTASFQNLGNQAFNYLNQQNPIPYLQNLGQQTLASYNPNAPLSNLTNTANDMFSLWGTIASENTPDAPELPSAPGFDAATYGKNMLSTLSPMESMDEYVKRATSGMTSAYENTLAKQVADLQSKYAAEGNYLSSPMFSAQGSLQADLTSQYLRDIGLMQLEAANQARQSSDLERQNIYGLAGQGMGTQADYLSSTYAPQLNALASMYGTEMGGYNALLNSFSDLASQYLGNVTQASTAGQGDYANLLGTYLSGMMGAGSSAYGNQADMMQTYLNSMIGSGTNLYNTNANFLGDYLNSMVGAQANMFGSQASLMGNYLNSMIGTSGDMSNAALGAQTSLMNSAMSLMEKGFATNFNQAMTMATLLQQNEQGGLDALREDYYQPGQNLMQILAPFLNIPLRSESKESSGGLGEMLGGGGLGGLLGGAADFGTFLTGV